MEASNGKRGGFCMLIKVRRPSSVLTLAEWGNKVSFQLLRLFFFFFFCWKGMEAKDQDQRLSFFQS